MWHVWVLAMSECGWSVTTCGWVHHDKDPVRPSKLPHSTPMGLTSHKGAPTRPNTQPEKRTPLHQNALERLSWVILDEWQKIKGRESPWSV